MSFAKLSPAKTARKVALAYTACFLFSAGVMAAAAGYSTRLDTQPVLGASQPLTNRVQYYLEHSSDFNVIFLGDSRTYCAMHPELIEGYVPGMHGVNLSNFANWFPTQLPLVRAIVPVIKAHTVVVWSVGHQNFYGGGLTVQRLYPISIVDAANYFVWGHGHIPSGLMDNVGNYHPMLRFRIAAQELRVRIGEYLAGPASDKLQAMFSILRSYVSITPVHANETSATASNSIVTATQNLESLLAAAQNDPRAVFADFSRDQGHVTSLIEWFRRGGYYRTEIDTAYFRTKQQEMGVDTSNPTTPDPLQWRIFIEMLDLLAAHHVKLVVNEVEEAPFRYGSFQHREVWRMFMRNVVQPEVEKRGFPYVRANWDALQDADYFDYNHLNSKGIAKYTPMIADIIKDRLVKTP